MKAQPGILVDEVSAFREAIAAACRQEVFLSWTTLNATSVFIGNSTAAHEPNRPSPAFSIYETKCGVSPTTVTLTAVGRGGTATTTVGWFDLTAVGVVPSR